MTKAQLVRDLATLRGLPYRAAREMVDDFLKLLAASVVRGELVDLRGFGTFSVRHAKPRKGRNLSTGDVVSIAARRVPFFRAGKGLLAQCQQQPEHDPAQRTSRLAKRPKHTRTFCPQTAPKTPSSL